MIWLSFIDGTPGNIAATNFSDNQSQPGQTEYNAQDQHQGPQGDPSWNLVGRLQRLLRICATRLLHLLDPMKLLLDRSLTRFDLSRDKRQCNECKGGKGEHVLQPFGRL
jgi:hypothetical protein